MNTIDAAPSSGSNPGIFSVIRYLPTDFSPFCGESIESISIWMGSVDASRSCATNPVRHFGIGRLVVEVAYALYCILHGPFLWSVVSLTLRVPMCAIDASRSFGLNAGGFIAIRDLAPE